MFIAPNIDPANNGVESPPEITLQGTTIKNIFFEFKSLFMVMNGGVVTFKDSTFTHISSVGSIVSDYWYTHYILSTFSTYKKK